VASPNQEGTDSPAARAERSKNGPAGLAAAPRPALDAPGPPAWPGGLPSAAAGGAPDAQTGPGQSLLGPLKVWAIVLSLCLVALAISVQYFLFDRLLPRAWSDAATAALLVAGVAGFSWEVWRLLERVEARLLASREAERAQRAQVEALAQASLDLAAGFQIDAAAQKIVDRSRAVTGTRYGALAVLGPDGTIEAFHTSGLDAQTRARVGPPPQGHGLLGLVMAEGRALRCADIASHPAAVGFPPHHPQMRTLLAVPVRAQGVVIGNLYLADKLDGSVFTASDQEALERFAAQAAAAIQNARLHQQLERLSIIAERERIAMDLHDGVIQQLFGVGLQLESVLPGLDPASPAGTTVGAAIDRVGTVMADIRHYIFDLRVETQGGQGLAQSLRQLVASLEGGPQLRTEVRVEGQERPVRRAVRWELWHIVREALANAARHSGAARVDVVLRFAPDALCVEVRDDGSGWDGQPKGEGHHGLENMRRRAEGLQAALTLETAPGHGTRLRVCVPSVRAFTLDDADPPAEPGAFARAADEPLAPT